MARKTTNSNSSDDRTQTIDLTRVLPAEVTTSGSFDLRRMETSHFGKFLQAIPLPILLINESLQVVFTNDACTSILLSQHGAAQAWLQSLLLDSSSAHTIDELVREVLTTRKTLTTEMHWEIDKRAIWGRLTLRPVRIAEERVALLLVEDLTSEKDRLKDAVRHETELAEVNERLGQEISHRIASEEALREREERYRHLVEHASDGIYSTDVNGFFTFVNATAARMCGYSPEEMLGKHYLDVIHTSHRNRVEEFYRIQFVKRLPHTYCEFPLLTTYGDVRWLGQSAQTIIKGDKVVGFQAVARDITDRKRLEAALRREKERFQVLAEYAPFGMVMVGKDGKFEYINPKFRELFGYELSDIPMGKEWCRRAYPDADYRHRVISAWLQDLSEAPLGEARPRTFTVRRNDGTSKIISFIMVQLSSGDHIVTCEDITEQTKAREELQEKERFLAGVFSSIQDGISVLDTDLNIVRVNESVERWYSHAAPLTGKKCYEAYHGTDAPCEACPSRIVLETGEPAHKVVPKHGSLGEIVGWLEVYCFPMQDESTGSLTGVIEYVRDITEQRQAEDQLREREQLLSTVLATSPVAIGLARDRRMVWANEACVRMLGFAGEADYVGRSPRVVYPSDDEFERVWQTLSEHVALGETGETDTTLKNKHGSLFDAVIRMRAVDPSDLAKGTVVAITDVTQQKRAQEEVRQTKQLLEAVVNATPDIVLSLDKDMTVRLCNASAAEGLRTTTGEVIGKNVADFLPPELAATRKAVLDQVVESGKPSRLEDQRAGLYLDHLVAPIFGDDGKVGSVVVVARDITSLRKAQEAERQNALLLKTILSASPVGIGLATWDGELGWVNDAWPAIFGFENPDDLLHENIRSLSSSREEFHRVDQIIYQTVWEGGVAEIDATMRRRDGSLFDAFIRASAVDHLDPTKGLICAITDVTDRRRAEQELRESEERYRLLVNMSPDGIGVYSGDVFLFANEAGARLLGTTPEHVVGRPVMEFVHPQFRDAVKERMRRVLECREAVPLHEGQVVRVDGSIRDVEVIEVPITYGGQPAGQLVTRDVTERKQMQEAIKKSEANFRAIFDSMNDAVFVHDAATGAILDVNKKMCEMYACSAEEARLLKVEDLSSGDPPQARGEAFRLIREATQGEPQLFEWIAKAKNGKRFWVEVNLKRCVIDERDTVLAVVRDITDRKKVEDALRESEARFREFAEAVPQVVYELDAHGNFTFLNRAGLELGGYGQEDIHKGFKLKDFVAPEDHERLLENIREVLLMGESTYGNEYTVIGKDGTRIPVASYSSAIVRADKVIGLRGVCVDIRKLKEAEEVLKRSHEELEKLVAERTAELELMNEQLKKEILDRVQVQQQLASSEERFRGIFETARDCVFIKDRSLRYTLVNPYMESLLELPASEIVGKLDSDLFDKADAEHLRAVDSRVLGGEVVEEEHSRIVRGTRLTFLNVKAPLCNTRGEVIGICGISRDITERVFIASPEMPTSVQYKSRAMTAAVTTAQLAASSDSTVLLTGESGSGKDYLARYIHDHSSRSSGPFYSINCAAIPAELAESELFGHESGAFTGATKRKRGLLEIAEGGTILLNEIAELTPELQAKLLSFMDTRALTRVGGEKVFTVNVRLIAATNRNLLAEVSAGRFRQDLFYRLDVFSIGVPPLRERLDDLPVLVQELMSQLAPAFGYSGGSTIHPRALDKMRRYPWPGNVRELRNVVERALILSGGAPPRVEHFQLERHEAIAESVPVSFPMHRPLSDVLDELEKSFVEEALSRSGGNKTDAARLLGISRFALARHMRKLGVSSDSMP